MAQLDAVISPFAHVTRHGPVRGHRALPAFTDQCAGPAVRPRSPLHQPGGRQQRPLWPRSNDGCPWPRLGAVGSSRALRVRRTQCTAAAGSGFAAALSSGIDMAVAAAAAQASFKLLFLCGLVAWMSHRDMLPPGTSQVLSQVAFNLTIPCMLLVSTAKTLAAGPSLSIAVVPLVAVAHVLMGAWLGAIAAGLSSGKWAIGRALFGWQPLHPTPSAAAIAASAAAAMGAPAAAQALLPKSGAPRGLTGLLRQACTFGNCMTLPLLYLLSLLPAAEATRATAYVALYHAAWAAMLWTLGYQQVNSPGDDQALEADLRRRRQQSYFRTRPGGMWLSQGLWQRIRGVRVPGTGQQEVLVPRMTIRSPSSNSSSGASRRSSGSASTPSDVTVAAEVVDENETPAEALLKPLFRALAAAWQAVAGAVGSQVENLVNPPLAAVVAGVVIGLSPLGPVLTAPSAPALPLGSALNAAGGAAAAGVVTRPWELGLVVGVLRSCWEMLEVLAGATLALQAVVLATSLFSKPAAGAAAGVVQNGSNGGAGARDVEVLTGEGAATTVVAAGAAVEAPAVVLTVRGAATADDASASVLQQLWPHGEWEWRTVCLVASVRFVALPVMGTALVLWLWSLGVLPPDRVCLLALLLQGTMPPAQSLVIMLQLKESTSALAPLAARLLLQLYTLAVVPVTAWIAVFALLTRAAVL